MNKFMLTASFTATSLMSSYAVEMEKPNIVLFIADDMSWHDIGCYGNQDVKTPNINQLAKEGIRFTDSFTATAMCAPTRQQLYTGLFPVRNGAYPNHSQVYKGTRSMVHHLKNLGYRVGLGGKTHFGPRSSFPFENICGRKLNFEKIEKFINRNKNQPFCLIVATTNPHAPWTEGDANQYDPEKLTLPPTFVDTPKTRLNLAKYYAEITQADKELGKVMSFLDKYKITQNTVTIFTSEQGSSFPFAKWTCYDSGLKTATITRWPDKVKANTVSSAMIQYVDVVPTLVEIAGDNPNQIDTGRPKIDGSKGFDGRSFKDVLTGKIDKHNDFVYGVQTSNGILAGGEYAVRSIRNHQFKLIHNLNHDREFANLITASAGKLPKGKEKYRCDFWPEWIAGDKAKAERYAARPQFELYDISKDPYEQNNLIQSPEYQQTVKMLQQKLSAWMQDQGDKGILTEKEAKQRKRH